MEANVNTWRRSVLAVLVGSVLGLTSCALGPDAHAKRFQEEQFANLIIRYSTEQTIYRLRPDGHEGSFFRVFDRNQICDEAGQLSGPRLLAVVLIDYPFAPHFERQIIDSWTVSFRDLDFQRVVFLRAQDGHSINGLRIVADVPLSRTLSRNSFVTNLGGS